LRNGSSRAPSNSRRVDRTRHETRRIPEKSHVPPLAKQHYPACRESWRGAPPAGVCFRGPLMGQTLRWSRGTQATALAARPERRDGIPCLRPRSVAQRHSSVSNQGGAALCC